MNYGVEIQSINKGDEGLYSVKTKAGDFEGANLAVCVPAAEASNLIGSFEPQISEMVSKIKYQLIESFGVVVEKEETDLKSFAGLVPVVITSYSIHYTKLYDLLDMQNITDLFNLLLF